MKKIAFCLFTVLSLASCCKRDNDNPTDDDRQKRCWKCAITQTVTPYGTPGTWTYYKDTCGLNSWQAGLYMSNNSGIIDKNVLPNGDTQYISQTVDCK